MVYVDTRQLIVSLDVGYQPHRILLRLTSTRYKILADIRMQIFIQVES